MGGGHPEVSVDAGAAFGLCNKTIQQDGGRGRPAGSRAWWEPVPTAPSRTWQWKEGARRQPGDHRAGGQVRGSWLCWELRTAACDTGWQRARDAEAWVRECVGTVIKMPPGTKAERTRSWPCRGEWGADVGHFSGELRGGPQAAEQSGDRGLSKCPLFLNI